MTLGEIYRESLLTLRSFSEDASLEARWIIEKVTGLDRPVLFSHPEQEISDDDVRQIHFLCQKRLQGIPLPYVLGEWGFYGLTFSVNPAVLIPRPETELLVDEAAAWLYSHPEIQLGADIGTGSGCIAISLLSKFSHLRMAALDISRNALRTAVQNARQLSCGSRFLPVQGDLSTALSNGIRLVCANLPYIPSADCIGLEAARSEPLTALDGGKDGFEAYRGLFSDLRDKIKAGTLILCEIEYRQESLALQTAAEFFPNAETKVLRDLAGLPRLLRVEL